MAVDPRPQGEASPRRGSNGDARRSSASRPRRPVEPTFFSRYECKYVIDPALLPQMRSFLEPFTVPDEFAGRRPGNRYPICSLYLDGPDLRLYQQTVGGEKDRFKLRIRTYSDDPSEPAFFEVKRKLNSIVHKRRAGVDRVAARDAIRSGMSRLLTLGHHARHDLEYFHYCAMAVEARPVMRVKYMREAYQGTGNEPVRITFDSDLTHSITLGDELGHSAGRWSSTPTGGVILEIKFTERFPWWIQDFIRTFGVFQRAVPKYVLSIDHMMLEGRESVLAIAGVTLPPRRSA